MPTKTVFDTGNQFSWASRVYSFEADYDANDNEIQGPLEWTITTYDSGLTLLASYENGGIRQTQFEDLASDGGLFDWSIKATLFNEDGTRIETTIFDNGIIAVEQFLDETTSLTTISDVEDVEVWTTITHERDNGFVDRTTITYDDQTKTVFHYFLGTPTHTYTYDNGNMKNWESYRKFYNLNGDLENTLITYDDGTTHATLYENGLLLETYQQDRLDVKNWSERQTAYDANGNIVFKSTTFDNGIVREEEWANGNRTEIRLNDVNDVTAWDSIQT